MLVSLTGRENGGALAMSTPSRIWRAMMPATFGLILISGATAWAQQQPDPSHDEHHPPGAQGQQGAPSPAPTPRQTAPTPAQRQAAPQRREPAAPGTGMRPGGQGMMMPEADMRRMMQMMQGMHGMMMGGMAGPGATRPFERVEGQLAYFRTELRITEAQMAQWNAFADVMRSQATRLRQAIAQAMSAEGQPATAPQLLERRLAFLTWQIETTRAAAYAVNRLYAVLSDEQKRLADELMAEHLRDMRSRGM